MVDFDFDLVMGIFWIVLGVVILIPGYLIAVRGRADLHVHYDDEVDPAYVSRRAGGTALFMGALTVGYGVFHLVYGYNQYAFAGLILSLLALSSLTRRFAQGWGAR